MTVIEGALLGAIAGLVLYLTSRVTAWFLRRRAAARGSGPKRGNGGRLRVLAATCFAGAALVPFLIFGIWESSGFAVLFTNVLTFLGLWCIRFARQVEQADASEKLHVDNRAPVLFLRQFATDLVSAQATGWRHAWFPWQSGYFEQMGGVSFDIMLQHGVEERLGPLIALGRPDDYIVPFGAARVYCGSHDWMSTVQSLANQASAILILAGTSRGLVWELRHVRAAIPPTKVFVLTLPIPFAKEKERCKAWNEFAATARELGYAVPAEDPGTGCVLAFSESWQAQIIARGVETAKAFVDCICSKTLSARREQVEALGEVPGAARVATTTGG